MGKTTGIAWTDSTFNPWWGCTKVSEGCANCYAENVAARTGTEWGPKAERRRFGDKHWAEPLRWNYAAANYGKRWLVFCASMADVFEDGEVPAAERPRLWQLIRDTPALTWQILTKRPENFQPFLPPDWGLGYPNVWLGVTAENQRRADDRLPYLVAAPATCRFVSYEPAIGPVNWRTGIYEQVTGGWKGTSLERIDWIIFGGEKTQRKADRRPHDLEWARYTRDQCAATGTSFFMKQTGDGTPIPDDLLIREMPLGF